MKALVADPWVVNAASAVVVALIVGIAAVLGFRQRAKVSPAVLEELARGEGQGLAATILAADGSAGVARLSNGALLIARVMADGVSARVVRASDARVEVTPRKVTIAFADVGFPPLHLPIKQAPPEWVAALAKGD